MKSLPPLLVANAKAREGNSLSELMALIDGELPAGWCSADKSISSSCKFRFGSLSLSDVSLLAFSMSPAHYKSAVSPTPVVSVCFDGGFSYRHGSKTIHEKARVVGTLTAGGEAYEGKTTGHGICRGLAFSPEPIRLAKTLHVMAGSQNNSVNACARLEEARELPLQLDGVDIFDSIKHLVGTIRLYEERPELMVNLALDDALYRHTAMMLRPDIFFNQRPIYLPNRNRVDEACDYMRANIDQPVSLTDIEAACGLSARTLQYAFKKRFNCTPMAWLTQERLNLAKLKLQRLAPGNTVSSVALDVGFTNFGKFSQKYREKFGELPSHTLARNNE